jgi:hypothetical protein
MSEEIKVSQETEETKEPQEPEFDLTKSAARYESLQFNLTINNRFSEDLIVVSGAGKPNWGKFVDGPKNISKKKAQVALRAWGKDSSPSGTEGTVKYQVRNDPSKIIEIYWSVPLRGRSSYNVKAPSSITHSSEGWNGSYWSENVVLTIGNS